MARYAHVVDEEVVNVIVWDGSTPFALGGGGLVESDELDIGDAYAGPLIDPSDP